MSNNRELAGSSPARPAPAAIIRRHQADGIRPIFSGQADSGRRIADVAREKQIQRRAEEIFILQKKWTLLREINRVALVHRDLRVFRFDLAEVRIRRQRRRRSDRGSRTSRPFRAGLVPPHPENTGLPGSRVSSARKPRMNHRESIQYCVWEKFLPARTASPPVPAGPPLWTKSPARKNLHSCA